MPIIPEMTETTPERCAEACRARGGDAATLAAMLAAARRDTLQTFAVYERALPGLRVPQRPELNPPLWELGHIGWFQEFWIGRFSAWGRGVEADPEAPRRDGVRPGADALYHSSQVPHARRWSLPLPDAEATRADLAAQLAQTLDRLRALGPVAGDAEADDPRLYFFRLALLHEDMHHEAALYMARGLDLAIDDARWQPPVLPPPGEPVVLPAGPWTLGSPAGPAFAFDNELGAHPVALPTARLDAQVLRWAEWLPFAEAGGYADPRWWDAEGWAWQQARPADEAAAPRHLRREATGRWWVRRAGAWLALDERWPAEHLSAHEARAWCRWADRRLPTEAEWERAACTEPGRFRWGDVWEWTASAFAAYPGFRPHPYRDYSAPWMDGRPVLRGASYLTQPRMRHPRYRNFFPPHRHDVPAGLRTCELTA